MPISSTAVLLSSVAQFAVTAFFLLALIPLLLLKHNSPQDSEVVQRLLTAYCAAAILTAITSALSYAAAGMPEPALASAVLVVLAIAMRRYLLPEIEELRVSVPFGKSTIARFRKLHTGAIAVNFVQLLAVVGIINRHAPI